MHNAKGRGKRKGQVHTGEGKRAKGRCIQGRGSALRGESATNEEGKRERKE